MPAGKYRELTDGRDAASSAEIARRVERARAIQQERFTGGKVHSNAPVPEPGPEDGLSALPGHKI